jgi:hypothetical protein
MPQSRLCWRSIDQPLGHINSPTLTATSWFSFGSRSIKYSCIVVRTVGELRGLAGRRGSRCIHTGTADQLTEWCCR